MSTGVTSRRLALVGLVLAFAALGSPAQQSGQHPGVGLQPLRFYWGHADQPEQAEIGTALEMPNQMIAGLLNQAVPLPDSEVPIRLLGYLPLAVPKQRIEPDMSPTAQSALRMMIEGPKLSYERCLITGSPTRNRMTSLIGSWRYISVAPRRAPKSGQ